MLSGDRVGMVVNVWGWVRDGSQLYGDEVGMEKNSWGWGGNGADVQYRVTL